MGVELTELKEKERNREKKMEGVDRGGFKPI